MTRYATKRLPGVGIFLAFILVLAIGLGGWDRAIAAPLIGAKSEMGAWETLPMPPPKDRMQSVHTILLPNGKVMVINGSSFRTTQTENSTGIELVEGVDVKDYNVINNTGLLDPQTGKFERIASPPSLQAGETNDLFCTGHLQLADGNVLFVSGTGRYYPGGAFTGNRQINLYNWQTNQWTALPPLKQGRWYPSLIPLANGKVVIFSGLKVDAPNQINPSLEILEPKTGNLQYIDLTTIEDSPFNTKLPDGTYDSIDLYPRVFPLADGRLLITGDEAGIAGVLVPHSSKKSYLMSIRDRPDGRSEVSFEVGPDRAETSKAYGTALQVPNSEDVLLLGGIIGTNSINFGRLGNTTSGFPSNSKVSASLQRWVAPAKSGTRNGKWEIVPDFLGKTRANLQAVILPDQEILVVNGGEFPQYKPIYTPQLLTADDSASGGYRTQTLNPAHLPRLYHNGAILLPDARVLAIGGNANRAIREPDGTVRVNVAQDTKLFFKSPKLLDKSGQTKEFSLEEFYKDPQSYYAEGDKEPFVPAEIWQAEVFSPPYLFKPGDRPEIVNAPEQIGYGQTGTITVKNATQRGSLVLVKLGAVTHSFDYGQRLAELAIGEVVLGDQFSVNFNVSFKGPENHHLYPPGYYMMFYLNESGKPSMAKMVKLSA